MTGELPAYTDAHIKAALLAAGASGTIYSLVMPESEAALAAIVDARRRYFDMYREPWSQKQDDMHVAYFDKWIQWSRPIVDFPAAIFPFRYPTAGASEGIFKIMAEYLVACRRDGSDPSIHIFDGEYEGFPAYAGSLGIDVVRHERANWRDVPAVLGGRAMFWISQPSAIDGMVWDDFGPFIERMARARPDVAVIPDLTYVGSVARAFSVDLHAPNIPAFVISHSKPFGGYYHRVGGVFSRSELPSLFGNKWFKNLQSLAWATEMMTRHGVFDLSLKYRAVQEEAARRVGRALDVPELAPADVMLLGIAPAHEGQGDLVRNVFRGSGNERVVRLCLTPSMTCLIDPAMAPLSAPSLLARWANEEDFRA
ncbi:hypothetical protein [Sphingopyxis sp.]|jgi:hypothetical protein|uniref:hypothetical protein n=1 Tax=Sphingopyxis sp. TaxID=1908224 RepID=UPI003F72E666